MDFQKGYFGIYREDGFFLASNYSHHLLDCINGLSYHLSRNSSYFKYGEIENMKNSGMESGVEFEMHNSDFIDKKYRHFYYKSIIFGKGKIHIFKCEHGSLNPKNKIRSKHQ